MEQTFGSKKWQDGWVQKIEDATFFEHLEQLVEEFTAELSGEGPPAPPRRPRHRPPAGPPVYGHYAPTPEERRQRHIYYVDSNRALRDILGESSPSCPIPLKQLYRHFQEAWGDQGGGPAAPRPRDLPPLRGSQAPLELCREFSPKEVREALRKVRKKRGRPERISPQRLREADAGGRILAAIFNRCLHFHSIPSSWRRSTAFLKHKKGDQGDPRSWRPLHLCSPLYKMYARGLLHRISDWARRGGVISRQQKAFGSSFGGHQEAVFLLQSVLDMAGSQRTECAVAKLDIENAFGSFSHRYIFDTLSELGVPGDALELLRQLCCGCTTVVRTQKGQTGEIALRKGLRQGCPLSPILFNLAMEPLIRYVASGPGGFSLYSEKVDVLAYADDIVLVADSRDLLQKMLDRASAAADWMGLRFKPSKCTALHICNRRLCQSEFTVQGRPLAPLRRGEVFTYLEVPLCLPGQSPQAFRAGFQAMLGEAEKINRSLLTPKQKMHALRTHLVPKISSFLKNVPVVKKDLEEASGVVAETVGGWYIPPEELPEETWVVFCILPRYAGKGVLDMQSLADMAVVNHSFRLLTCRDEAVAGVAFQALLSSAEKNSGKRELSERDLAGYLNGGWDSPADCWGRARNATRRLRGLVRWSHTGQGGFGVEITPPGRGKKQVFLQGDRGLEAALTDAVLKSMSCFFD